MDKDKLSLADVRNQAQSAVESEIKARELELASSLKALNAERDKALSGEGADTLALERCEGAIRPGD